MKLTCGIFTNIAPLYSRPLWYELASSENVDYHFYSSRVGFSGIKTIDIKESHNVNESGKLQWYFLKNFFIGKYIFFQTGIISRCILTDYDAYILYGEMHCLSNWIAALICKLRNKPVLIWGHGIYGNESYVKKTIRLLYYRLADYNLVYNERARKLMIDSGFKPSAVITVYNSLDYSLHKKLYNQIRKSDIEVFKSDLFQGNSKLRVVIFIGRLIKEKKISLLLEAIDICRKRGNEYNCLIVGSGSEENDLRKLAGALGISDLIHFFGSSYDENINSKLIMMAECCVSPGNVGLTAIHSLSLGTPVITHNNMFNQGPEAEAIVEGRTGLLFEENNVDSLSNCIDDIVLNNKKGFMEKLCIEEVDNYWNPQKQVSIFDEAVKVSIE